MNRNLRYIAILAIIPLFTAGLTSNYFIDVDALKSKGTETMKFGMSTDICGLRPCSEIPGGKTVWEAQQKGTSSNTLTEIPSESIAATTPSKST